MINPSEICPDSLPSVAIDDRKKLPETPCVYFAIDSDNVIQYIGRSLNPRQRWAKHHRTPQLVEMGGVRIAYLEMSDSELLPEVEKALIDWFAPSLNSQRGRTSEDGKLPPRYTLVQNPRRQSLFEEIWERYPRLRGDTARTMDLALELMADGAPQKRPELGSHAPNITPAAPPEPQIEDPEIDDNIFAGVEI